MTPHFFYISIITNSSSYSGESLRKKSMLENSHANVLKSTNGSELFFFLPLICRFLKDDGRECHNDGRHCPLLHLKCLSNFEPGLGKHQNPATYLCHISFMLEMSDTAKPVENLLSFDSEDYERIKQNLLQTPRKMWTSWKKISLQNHLSEVQMQQVR